jgi:hypothetical protein
MLLPLLHTYSSQLQVVRCRRGEGGAQQDALVGGPWSATAPEGKLMPKQRRGIGTTRERVFCMYSPAITTVIKTQQLVC